MATFGGSSRECVDTCKASIPNGKRFKIIKDGNGSGLIVNGIIEGEPPKSDTHHHYVNSGGRHNSTSNNGNFLTTTNTLNAQYDDHGRVSAVSTESCERRNNSNNINNSGPSCATDTEALQMSCNSSSSGGGCDTATTTVGQPRILSQLIVESSMNSTNNTTISTTTAPTKMLASCDIDRHAQVNPTSYNSHHHQKQQPNESPTRSASTCGMLESFDGKKLASRHLLIHTSKTNSGDVYKNDNSIAIPRNSLGGSSSIRNITTSCESNVRLKEKSPSETTINSRGRSIGSTTITPFQMVKLQATQRQLSQNETTTRLLIAVMIVFLICEFPAGILAALCAILGQDFFDNVYQPMGILTDLLALINSSVNFILYCFMSTQFRITFYRVVLHCPAPSMQTK